METEEVDRCNAGTIPATLYVLLREQAQMVFRLRHTLVLSWVHGPVLSDIV